MHFMKKFLSATLALVLTFALLPVTAFADDGITVTTNGRPVTFADQGPVIVDGRTLVPVAGVFQALGFDTQWDGDARQVTITRAGDVIVVTIDSSTFTTNSISHNLDVPAQIIGGRTMLPIAAVLRSVGYDVSWDEGSRTVAITSASQAETVPIPAPVPEPTSVPEPEIEPEPEVEETTPEPEPTQAPTQANETVSQRNAVRSAESYINIMPFSRSGLIAQLEFEGYSNADATHGVDSIGADWNVQAARSAQGYLDLMPFSRSGLIDQLIFEGFTREQATYGVDAVGL